MDYLPKDPAILVSSVKMNIEKFREYSLSLPGVTEATPFEEFSGGKLRHQSASHTK